MNKYNSLIGNIDQNSIGNSASANILSYQKDGEKTAEHSLKTNESTPIATRIKAVEVMSQQRTNGPIFGENVTASQTPQHSTPTAEGKMDVNFTTNAKAKHQRVSDPTAS